jgi:hypothetical protein
MSIILIKLPAILAQIKFTYFRKIGQQAAMEMLVLIKTKNATSSLYHLQVPWQR